MTISNALRNLYYERKARKKVQLSRSKFGTFLIFLFLFIIGAFMALPLVYSVVQAFKPLNEIYAYPPKFFVREPTLDNFYQVYELANNLWVPLSRYVLNSVFISVSGTLFYVIIASLAAYPLAKVNFPGKKICSLLIVLMILFRTEVTEVPRYVIIAELGMVTKIDADTVAKIIVKDAGGEHNTLDGIDWNSVQCVGFDIKDVGVFGYILPNIPEAGSIVVTYEDGYYVIEQSIVPENNTMLPSEKKTNNANDLHMGQRVYTDESHSFDVLLRETYIELNPISEALLR